MLMTRKQLRNILIESIFGAQITSTGPGQYNVIDLERSAPDIKKEIRDVFVSKAQGPTGAIGERLLENYILPQIFSSTTVNITNTNKWAEQVHVPSATGFGMNTESAIGGLGDSYAIDVWVGNDPQSLGAISPAHNYNLTIDGVGVSMKYSMVTSAGSKKFQPPHLITSTEVINATGYVLGRYFTGKTNPIQSHDSDGNVYSTTPSDHIKAGRSSSAIGNQKRVNITTGPTTGTHHVHEFAWNALEAAYRSNGNQPITITAKFQAVNGAPVPVDFAGEIISKNEARQSLNTAGLSTTGVSSITSGKLSSFFNALNASPKAPPFGDQISVIGAIQSLAPGDLPGSTKIFGLHRTSQLPQIKRLAVAGYTNLINKMTSGVNLDFEFDATPETTYTLTIRDITSFGPGGKAKQINCEMTATPSMMQNGAAGHNIPLVRLNVGNMSELDISFLGIVTKATRAIMPSDVAAAQQSIAERGLKVLNIHDTVAKRIIQRRGQGIPAATKMSQTARALAANDTINDKAKEFNSLVVLIHENLRSIAGLDQGLLEAVYDSASNVIIDNGKNIDGFLLSYFNELADFLETDDFYTKGSASPQTKAQIKKDLELLKAEMIASEPTLLQFGIDLAPPLQKIDDLFLVDLGPAGKRIDTLLELKASKKLANETTIEAAMSALLNLIEILGDITLKTGLKDNYINILNEVFNMCFDFVHKFDETLQIYSNKLYENILRAILKHAK